MANNRWQKVKEVFHAALERAPDERPAFLAEACAGDEALRKDVESLIEAHEKEGSFIDSPAFELAAGWLTDDAADSLKGQQINHYRILEVLGAGGMGEVYLAQDMRLGRNIALKLLPASFTNDTDRLQRFQQEARAASALNHPNILTIHEVGEVEGRPYIATELIEGDTLRQRLSMGAIEADAALDIIMQAASALVAAHEVGIIHRDIKPENIMLRPDGYVKVLDFGLAKLAERKHSSRSDPEAPTRLQGNTSPGMVMGTVNYMSPEQARGLVVDERTDIWSLGVVFYEMLSGHTPFQGQTPTDVTVAILEREPQPLAALFEDVPAELDWIVKKALRKDREERYQTIRELLGDLRGVKQELEFEAKLERTTATPDKSVSGRREASLKRSSGGAGATTNRSTVIATDEIKEAQEASVPVQAIKPGRSRALLIAALAAVGLAVVAVALYKVFFQSKQATVFQAGDIKRLTNHGKATQAAISPDGKYVVYVLSDAGKQSLWLRQISAANDTQILPPAPLGYFGVTFSRDGNDLYYVIKQNDPGTLYRVPLLGGTPVKLLERIDCPVSFSPDGKRLAFVRGDYPNRGQSGLYTANVDGSDIRQIAARKLPELFYPIFFTGPSWSPDGRLIAAAVTSVKSEGRLIIFNLEDGSEQVLTTQVWPGLSRVEWLPDMTGLLMIARDQSSPVAQIWHLSYPDGEVRKVTNDLSFYRALSLTSDAKRLVTIETSGLINMWIVEGDDTQRAVQLPSGGQVQSGETIGASQLPVGNLGYLGGNEAISWTPDGRIVFISAVGKQGEIWIMDADGSNRKQLTSNAGSNHNPAVSPDGRTIVFTSDRTGSRHLWRMNIDGSDQRQLANGLAEFLPSISPDGQWVLYSAITTGKVTLWKVPIAGGTPVEINNREGFNPVVSPDGRQIAYLFAENAPPEAPPNRIGIINFEGGENLKTFEIQAGLAGARTILHWSKDGRSLLYTVITNNVSNIWRQPVEGGKPVQVTNFKENLISAFDWSRDGRTLAVSRGLLIRDAVLISNSKPSQ